MVNVSDTGFGLRVIAGCTDGMVAIPVLLSMQLTVAYKVSELQAFEITTET